MHSINFKIAIWVHRFQSHGDDDGDADGSVHSSDIDDDDDSGDIDLKRAKRAQRERPLSFANMSEVRDRFESGAEQSKEERREERKQEIQNIRSRLFMGKQAKIKEMYQQAVADSEHSVRTADRKPEVDIGDKAKSIKDRFERGLGFGKDGADNGDEDRGNGGGETDGQWKLTKPQDEDVFEQGLCKQSRSIFMEMDANSQQQQQQKQHVRQSIESPKTEEIKRLIRPSVSRLSENEKH